MAVDYTDALSANWIIFPLYPIKNGKCTCENEGCEAAGKQPKAKNWQHSQHLDETQLAYLEDFDGLFFGNQLLDHPGGLVQDSAVGVVGVDGRAGGCESAEKRPAGSGRPAYIGKPGSGAAAHSYFTSTSEKSRRAALSEYPGIDLKRTA